jgi:hypothetical protein
MASRIKAINAYRPRIKVARTVQREELVRTIARRTGLDEGQIYYVLTELRDAVVDYNRAGMGVKLEGLGTYLPNMGLDGSLDVHYRQDAGLRLRLNQEPFEGHVVNRENVGKTADELVALWNEEHPDDPVQVQ